MKLQQGQLWRTTEGLVRVVELERLRVGYKRISDIEAGAGTHHEATKKEFCRMLKGATLIEAEPSSAPAPAPAPAPADPTAPTA